MRIFTGSLLCILSTLALTAQDRVEFKPKRGYPTFAVREPVLTIKPGTTLVSNTMMGAYYTEKGGAFPGEVGPILVEGATTADTLVVRILKVQPNYPLAASNVRPTFGGLSADNRLRLLNEPIDSRRYLWRLDPKRMTGKTQLPGSRLKEIESVPCWAGWRWPRGAKRLLPASGPGISAATWTPPNSARGLPFTFPSSMTAPMSTSETGMPARGRAKSPARVWRRAWMSSSAST